MTSPEPRLPINILLVVRPAAGGIRTHIIELIRRIDRSRFDVAVAAPRSFLDDLPQSLPRHASLEIPLSSKTSPADFLSAARIAGHVRESNSIVHAHGMRAAFVCALASQITRFPLVTTLHNIPPRGKIEDVAIRFARSRSSTIIAVSQAIASQLDTTKTVVIPNGIDLAHFAESNRESARARLSLPASDFVVGCVSRLSPEKGIDILLRTARLMPDAKFIIAGDGPERERLISSAPPNVQMLGYVADSRLIYGAADIIAMPSRSEGQGIVALEAMASGTAVIASNVGGLAETVEHGVTGLLVPPDDPSLLASAIHKLQDTRTRARLASKALAWVEKNGDVNQRVREIEKIYERLRLESSLMPQA